MPFRRSEKAIPLALAAGVYALAILQRPGIATSDTKIDLHVDPVGFLGRVAHLWSPTTGLGHVQGGQYGGYLWPMAPLFALGHELGISAWLVQRLWLGTILALACWGVVRLLDALLGRPRGVAHVAAAVIFAVNPYTVVLANRTTATLVGYAALPWLLLCVHRGLRDPRRWWWPAAFALVLTSTGGGVNAAVTAWLLPGPLLLLLYEPLVAGLPWRSVREFGWRTVVTSIASSIWWFAPGLLQSMYGLDFLRFTEQIGSIWSTTSLPESLRLMGYWPSYLGVGYGDTLGPYFGDSGTMLFNLPVVVASLVVPGLAIAGFAWTRRWRYGPFFLALTLLGLLCMSVGFPWGTPLRGGVTFAYNHVGAIQFLRTTNKAGPLVALGIASLGGAVFAEVWRRLPAAVPHGRVAVARTAVVAGAAALVALAALPLVRGGAIGLTWKRIPPAWRQAARSLDRGLPRDERAAVLPGQPFAFYRWGGTVDPILPSLTKRPVAIRNTPPYDDIHAVDFLWTLDGMLHQRRLVPGSLAPALGLMSTGAVVSGTDDAYGRSGGMQPVDAAHELAAQGLGRPTSAYGPVTSFAAAPGSLDGPARLPEVRTYRLPRAEGVVRLETARAGMVVDGAARGLLDLAAFGGLPRGAPLRYAGDLSRPAVRTDVTRGGVRDVVIDDSNRRQTFAASRSRQSAGWTLAADVAPPHHSAILDPFPSKGSDAQTVAVYEGARYVNAPFAPDLAQFPERRPFAAFDGDPRTSWQADPVTPEQDHWVEVGLTRARDVPYVDVLPDDSNPRVAVTRVDLNGLSFAIHRGWNRLPVRLRGATAVRVLITGQRTSGRNTGTAGGFREVRVPGVHVRELLRPPVLAERALAGADLRRTNLSYVFSRTTADDPFRRAAAAPPLSFGRGRAEAEAGLIRAAQDAEVGIDRRIAPPAARTWAVDGFATVSPAARDSAIDALMGAQTGGATLDSSGRYEGRPGFRASSAFDGNGATEWASPWFRSRHAWIEWTSASPRTVRSLALRPGRAPALRPSRVQVSVDGRATGPVAVAADGRVELRRPVRGRRVRIDVVAAVPVSRASAAPAVAISEIRGDGVPAARVPRGGDVRSNCGTLAATGSGSRLALRGFGPVAALDAGQPLRVAECGRGLSLRAGPQDVHVPATGLFRPYLMRLRSPASTPAGLRAASAGGSVIASGHFGRGSHTGVRLNVRSPSWLVLGESFNRGWTAECDGHSLGAPRVVDGFANGWPVGPGCHRASFVFAPQRIATWCYVVGALACLVLLLIVLLRRPRASPPADAPPPLAVDDTSWRQPVRRAVIAGVVAAAVFGFVFALRAGVVAAPVVAFLAWRGVSPRSLILSAGVLLVIVVPLLYVLFPGTNHGGYDTEYAVEHLGAHWVAVAAFVLLVIALARTLARPRPSARPAETPPERRVA